MSREPAARGEPAVGREPAARRFVDWALRHGRVLWAVALLLAVPAATRTAWLYAHLRSDLEELLPADAPSVQALAELRQRLGGRQYLAVVVDAGDAAAVPQAERFVDALAERARAYPDGMLASVRTGNQVEAAFLERHAALYVDLADLREIRGRVEARRDYDVAKATGALLDDDAPPPPLDFHDIQSRYEKRLARDGASGTTRYTNVEQHTSVLLLELGRFSSGVDAAARLLDRVQGDVAAVRASGAWPAPMRVGYAGDAAIAVEEQSALVVDLSRSSVLVVLAVMGAIVAYYRWWRSVFVVLPPLLLATAYAFGAASLPPFHVTAVNSNTAFLGSILVGNGINFGLVLLARYVEERRAGLDVRTSLERAVAGSRAGTFAAAAAACASYSALGVTQFQGFRQFGVIGGFGMIFAWATAYLLVPSLVAWLDTGEATRPRPVPERGRLSYWLTRGVARAPRVIVALSAVATLAAIVAVSHFRASDLESDFSRLRRRDTWTSGEGYWGKRLDASLGERLTPLVMLADRPEDARALARALKAAREVPPLVDRIERVRTLDDVLPSDQETKVEEVAALREDLTPAIRESLPPDTRAWVDRWIAGAERPLGVEDLPRAFTQGLRERDGTVGRIVLVYPAVTGGWWNADAMATLVGALRDAAREAAPRDPPRLAGSLPLSSDIVQAIRRDAPVACGAALLGVIVMVAVVLRSARTSAIVIAALVVGVAWLAGASHALGIRINFANFIAFPITLGIGVDYAVNVIARYQGDGARDILGAVRSTGAAVALCSTTTIIGYASLLLAQNRALFLFGLLAVLGEVACLGVALVSLPACVLAFRRRAARVQVTAPSGPGTCRSARSCR